MADEHARWVALARFTAAATALIFTVTFLAALLVKVLFPDMLHWGRLAVLAGAALALGSVWAMLRRAEAAARSTRR